MPSSPIGSAGDGTPIYFRSVPQGFLLVVEAKRGVSGRPVGLQTFNWDPGDPNLLPDFQLVSARPLGDGSPQVCDALPGNLGGVPAVDPPVFGGTQASANAINDIGCRFESRANVSDSCTVDPVSRDPKFVSVQSVAQFCSAPGVGVEIQFPSGDTRLTVRVRDNLGQPGFAKSVIIRVP